MVTTQPQEVTCDNKRCPYILRLGHPRYVGEDFGAGGKWQCRKCGVFTVRGTCPVESTTI